MEQCLRLEPDIHSARQARRFVDRALGGWDGAEERDYAVLLVSELVTNAIRHAHTPMEVRVALEPDCIKITVLDEDPRLPELQRPQIIDESGWGLATVDALADDWDVQREGNGKAVWFRLASRSGSAERRRSWRRLGVGRGTVKGPWLGLGMRGARLDPCRLD